MSEPRPRLVIAAPQGRSGKTTVTATLVAGLAARGLAVQPFKKGPDFIDPSWLSQVAGRACRNLDLYLMPAETVRDSFFRAAADADVAVVEGAMGLFDGLDLEGSNSTAELAKLLAAPVILVLNVTRMTRSAAAVVLGCQKFDPELNIAGVVLNNVARPRHLDMLTGAIDRYCGLPVVGAIPKRADYAVPDRHLGLVPAGEDSSLHAAVAALARDAAERLDIDRLLAIAASAPPLDAPLQSTEPSPAPAAGAPRIGVVRDRAFTFYYPENLEALQSAGAALVYIDALLDPALPPVDGLYIGGGFPEVFAGELEANAGLREAIRRAAAEGMPVYAECGGLMYLGEALTWKGRRYAMAGALPLEVDLDEKPRGHGYMLCAVEEENPFFPQGALVRGHEFHHSSVTVLDRGRVRLALQVRRGYGIDGRRDGAVFRNVFAAYNHIHALGVPEWAPRFVEAARSYRAARERTVCHFGG
ncbi:MAG: cobyrinate a,c-diamide synthase [Thermoanaerobacterales bacterium]|nr:cobyrinate a,c-diamide synthase [Bacillota bacterium]MDI6907231.1 cobyrinate a,c-diamide synthase [Thermoanaerobacterales bacterium]